MAKIVLTAQVEDLGKWEEAFRKNGDLFRSQNLKSPILIGTNGGNEIALYQEVDLETFQKVVESSETAEAMARDGVRRETVKVFVMDKDFSF